jgi:hypothetical protein
MDVFDVLRKKLRERMNDIADAVSTGGCADIEEYRRQCGVIEGLAHAERDLLDMKASYEASEDN